MSPRRLPTRWFAFALRVLGVVLVVGFLGGAAVATEGELDRTAEVEAVEIIEDLEPDTAVAATTPAPALVRDLRDCRSVVARRLTMARTIAPAVPPPRA